MNTIGTIKEVIPETFLSEVWHVRTTSYYHRGVGRFRNLVALKSMSQIHEIRINPLSERVQGDIIKQKSPLRQIFR